MFSIKAAGADKDEEGLRRRKESSTEVKLVKSSGAQFQGSFAAGARHEHWTKENESSFGNKIYQYLFSGWGNKAIWKAAIIEFIGTLSLTYMAAMVSGHLNPMITFTTLLTGLIEFPRAVLYILAQVAGGSLSGGLIRGGLGHAATENYRGGGCFLDNDRVNSVSLGQAFLLEMSFALISIFLAFALGLDPRQATLFSPAVGPALVGLSVGILIFAAGGLGFSGYSGPSFNPGRCLAYSVARNNWESPMTAAIIQSVLYRLVPPFRILSSSDDKLA
ncbi:aquaporin-like protein [Dactylonectria macrodidyma]|uniref:Aquaporin-like protein n=1 Tax=Dactylonectria macrodidyma TaxID=307937 RepID=A0A9P9DC55_9HYPO|nr:aquaporin-like protein [Dactylonectria macrodidyma]